MTDDYRATILGKVYVRLHLGPKIGVRQLSVEDDKSWILRLDALGLTYGSIGPDHPDWVRLPKHWRQLCAPL